MDYQEVLSRFTYDDGTDIRNRISAVEAGDYRENRDIINGEYGIAFLLPRDIPHY